MNRNFVSQSSAVIALAVVCLAGCSQLPGIDIAPVEGVVTQNGQPLSGARITFYPRDGRPSVGTTDDQGHYSLQFTADRTGAMVGIHEVVISVDGMPEPDMVLETGKRSKPTKRARPMEVAWPEPVTVEDQPNQLNFDL